MLYLQLIGHGCRNQGWEAEVNPCNITPGETCEESVLQLYTTMAFAGLDWMPGHQKCNSSRDMTKVPFNFFFFFLVMLPGLQDLSSPSRIESGSMAMKVPVLTSGPPGNSCHWTSSYAEKWHLIVQLCPTLYDPMDCSPPGSSVHGLLQAKILEWVAISSVSGWRQEQPQGKHGGGYRWWSLMLPWQEIWVVWSQVRLLSLVEGSYHREGSGALHLYAWKNKPLILKGEMGNTAQDLLQWILLAIWIVIFSNMDSVPRELICD